jgi:hypothetical protein
MIDQKLIPELLEVEQLAAQYPALLKLEKLAEIQGHGRSYPLYGFSLGNPDPTAPTFGLFGGVHGLERVGSHVLIEFLRTLLKRLTWEKDLQELFKSVRLVSIPVINPMGMSLVRRANGNGVDLMRNSPLEASGNLLPLVSGHRLSPLMPWFRGIEGSAMEVETQTVLDFCRREFFQSQKVITLDLHSGFGFRDRLWYPWATSNTPFPQEPEVLALKSLFESTYPFHVYIIEHQAIAYTNHGDLWDWIFQLYLQKNPRGVYLPLTLEMGSWMWVKKNPWQFFSWQGLFNPIKKHRYARTMRRHQQLLEFLLKATGYHEYWSGKI